jgi:hypothetical protein
VSTEAQLEANRQNAQQSTGPRTESGKSNSSRNALTYGLYTRQDYVKPDEREIYRDFCERMLLEMNPDTLVEETLVSEITGASWRLRRCSAVEAELADFAIQDPMLDETKEKFIRSLERARSTASSLLHRGINQLRRLQNDRLKTRNLLHKPKSEAQSEAEAMAEIEAFCAPPKLTPEQWAEIFNRDTDPLILAEPPLAELSDDELPDTELASNCSPQGHAATAASAQAPEVRQIPRSAPCPCGSREKYKRCCGKNAPPVLTTPARRAA